MATAARRLYGAQQFRFDPASESLIVSLADSADFHVSANPVGSLQVNEPYRLVGTTFGASIDTRFWTAANGGGASAASGVAASIATIASGTATAATGYGKLTSVRSGRFVFAHPHRFRAAIRLTSVAVVHCDARAWGAVSLSTVAPQDGPYFSVNAAGTLSVNHASNGSLVSVASGSFNGNVASYTLDTDVHAYEIVYFTMGIWFFIDGVLIHKILPTTSVLYRTLTVPINIWSANDATGGVSGVVECWNAIIVRLGRHESAPAVGRITGNAATYTLKIGAGVIQHLTFNNTSGTSITLYDAVTAVGGTELAIITTATAALGSWDMHYPFYTGLTVVTVGNSLDATILYE